MKFLKKHFVLLASALLIAFYFFTRVYNLLGIPMFTDEAIYIRWAQIAGNDAAWRFISLTDGKQPMFVWIAMILMRFFDDPLVAGRVVSVLAGFFSMCGIFLVTNTLFKNKYISLLASLFYILLPFSLVYDRMALYDSLVSMFIIWGLYVQILFVRNNRLDLAMILGIIAGLGMLTKSSDSFILILLPFSLVLFDFKTKKWKSRLFKLVGLALVTLVLANAIYAILRLSPFFHIITEKNYLFIYSPSEWLQHPFTYFINNLRTLFGWFMVYVTPSFLILVIMAFLLGKKYLKENLFLLLWFIVPFIALCLFGKLLYPRYILFMTMSLLPLAAYTLFTLCAKAKTVWMKGLVFVVFLSLFVYHDYYIITDFAKAPVPKSDKSQFITDWPAGVGVNETVMFLREKAKSQKIFVGTGGTFGLMPYSLEIYLHDNPNVKTMGYWPIDNFPPKEIIDAAKKMPTYFVFYQSCASCPNAGVAPAEWQQLSPVTLTPILQIERLEKGKFYTLYQIKSK